MITILLATYNGEQYLAEQLESILAQTEQNWRLVIQDDCSADGTVAVARQYANAHSDRIEVIQRAVRSGSAKNNFFSMLQYVGTEYWMTCDQDDIWLPNKIEVTLEMMRRLEEHHADVPLLVHSDLMVIDQKRNTLAKSFYAYQKLDAKRDSFANLLSQNIVTGCTALMNRALLDKIHSLPAVALMHDWWFALVAAAFGKIAFVEHATVLYRQHGRNSVGAKDAGSFIYLFKRAMQGKENIKSLESTFAQAKCFLSYYEKDLSEPLLNICRNFEALPKMNTIKKIQCLHQFDFWKSGMARRIGQLLYL